MISSGYVDGYVVPPCLCLLLLSTVHHMWGLPFPLSVLAPVVEVVTHANDASS